MKAGLRLGYGLPSGEWEMESRSGVFCECECECVILLTVGCECGFSKWRSLAGTRLNIDDPPSPASIIICQLHVMLMCHHTFSVVAVHAGRIC